MAVAELWTNADGLQVRTGLERSGALRNKFKTVHTDGVRKEFYAKITYNNLPGFDADANNDGTLDSFDKNNEFIPVKAYIESAKLLVTTAFTTSTSAALQIGTYQADGTVIDADGIDVAIAAGTLLVNAVINCDGAQVGTIMPTYKTYLRAYATTGSFTAGEATLVLTYVVPLL